MLIGASPIKIILFGGLFGFLIITTAFKTIKGKITRKDILCNLKITIDEKDVYVKAILDTGNFLREPITKTPVVVVEKEELSTIIPNNVLDNLCKIIDGENIEIGEYSSKIRIIPFTSIRKGKWNFAWG